DGDARASPERTVRERAADGRAVVRDANPLDQKLAERHLELLDDLGPLVRPGEDGAKLPRLLCVEPKHCLWILVVLAAEVVDLADAVVVEDDGQARAVVRAKAVFDAD